MADKKHIEDVADTDRVPVSSRVAKWVVDAIESEASEIRPMPNRSMMLAMILEDWAKANGYKPPKE